MALTEETSVPVRNTPTRGEETIQLDDDCVFPVIRGECGPVMRDLTPERIHEILETEDIEKALYSRGR